MRLVQPSALVALAVAVGITSPAADAASKAVDFLFSEDNQIVNTPEQFQNSITEKTLVRDDKWLNEPLTRLDYVLIRIQAHLNTTLSNVAQHIIREDFDTSELKLDPSVEFSPGYSDEKGRLFIGASVGTVGKPKKPMKEFCQTLLIWIEQSYPLKPLGYAWQNSALGLLIRNDAEKYQDVVQKLAESAIITVKVSGGYTSDSKHSFFQVGCMRQEGGGPITFYKYSSALN
jgi:hypothetical protein